VHTATTITGSKRQLAIWGDQPFATSVYVEAINWDREVSRKGIAEPVAAKK